MVFVNSTECKDSAITVRKVESCPQNVKEWKEAAAWKGCEKMTCSSFEYHCVINAWGNETIEVCAPRLLIIEPEKFNVEEGREVENHLLEVNTITQDVFHELNGSSDNTNLDAILS
uniref:Uncharacterized protein n=1 Tax=Magallana gigas TaxID=29159 RepID=A0A8W8MLL9_MAGGI